MTQWFSWKRLFGGTDVEPWLPPPLDESLDEAEPRPLSPVAGPIHVLSGSALVRIDNGVLVIERVGETAVQRPVELVSALHIHGWATITSPCVAELVRQGTPVVWRGVTGYPVGCATPMHQPALEARRAQYAAARSPKALAIARALVAAKIVNMRGLVRRRAALPGRDCLGSLQRHAAKARSAASMDMLYGIEGAATALYFAAWPEMISARAGDLTLTTRTRRPPRDEINAFLSYAYAVLAGECLCACVAAGLDPRQGFLHRERAGRPALALDLMEPFRPLIADQAALAGLNNGQLQTKHFVEANNAVLLSEDGRRLALQLLESRFARAITLDGRAEPVTWREAIGLSVQALARALATETPFQPIEWA